MFDVTELSFGDDLSITRADTPDAVIEASSLLSHAADHEHVGLERISSTEEDLFPALHKAAEGQQLLAIGTAQVVGDIAISFGAAQDRILREFTTDVLLTVWPEPEMPAIKRILVPLNGLGHSLAAADVAAYIAKGSDAEVVLLTAVAPRLGSMFWRERKHRDLLQAGYTITREAQARIARLEVKQSERVVLAENAAEAALAEMKRQPYDLLLLGSVMRTNEQGISLGRTVEHLLQEATIPRALLVSRTVDVS